MTAGSGISVVIPALHEEGRINACLQRIFEVAGAERPEVIVVDGDPEVGTLGSIDTRYLGRVILLRSARGRARQMNAGAEAAGGDILLFLHADTWLPDDAFERILAALDDPSLAGGASSRRFRAEGRVRCFLKDLALYAGHALGVHPRRLKLWYPDHGGVRPLAGRSMPPA